MLTSVVPSTPSKPPGPALGLVSMKRPSSKRLLDVASSITTPPQFLSRSSSTKRGITRSPTRRSLGAVKREIPPHLVKLLQKTPEQQARVEAVKAILADEPGHRNELSLDIVYDWMLHNCKQYSNNIFGSAPEYIRREICRQMRLIKATTNQLLIRQGDTGDRCYIVIDGLVDVYIKKETRPSVDKSEDQQDEAPSPQRTSSRRGSIIGPAMMDPAALTKEYGDMVANLGPGAMFGEVVLMNPSARRNATILATQYTETCELIFLERADYIRLVRGASMEASHYNQAEILDHMYLFHGWSKHDKMRLVSGMRSLHFATNDYLYRAGSDAKWMFIVSSGEVLERINWSVASSASSNSLPSSVKPGDVPEKKVNIDLLIVGPGDIVGEFPFVKSKWSSTSDIRALSDVHALALDRRVYEHMIVQATPESNRAAVMTYQRLQRLCEEREDWRQQRLACGVAYPSAPISMTWQVMRMSNLRCPRCGQRGHLAGDSGRCSNPSPKRLNGANSGSTLPLVALKRRSVHASRRASGIGSPAKKVVSETATSLLKELFDETYLPSAQEQLAQCRLEHERRRDGQSGTGPVLPSQRSASFPVQQSTHGTRSE
ncbi:hypothetical protein Poli38472_011313 [Pythium oligandrum]|uniref:Cyclic nucleotide-binding domain-containing protein n=1 Tax=Pythium oligandrum TaxID=41045 RepID=A0A8K1FRL3_PYTOL|nr:hypothetical protein Poli38472_011313 [Pythium oligandrum]|eukprot:TMW67693.1 hypothetical protein Poli38472_011313 [Pythium oligandrum]